MDAFQVEIRERLTRIESRLEERCATEHGRIDAIERSVIRFGERIGKLEAKEDQRKGGMAVIAAVGAVAGSIGAFLVKLWTGGQ